MSPKPQDRPSAEKVLASSLLAGRRAGSPRVAAAQLVHQNSTASTQSATTVDGAAPAVVEKAPTAAHAGGGGSKHFAGLVLQRSTLK